MVQAGSYLDFKYFIGLEFFSTVMMNHSYPSTQLQQKKTKQFTPMTND